MSNYLIKSETLTNIANAIRIKTGKTDSIQADNMASEISNLPIYPLYDGAVEEINLAYTLNRDGASYTVKGMGEVTSSTIIIPNTYKGLPVTVINPSGFYYNLIITSFILSDNIVEISDRFDSLKNLVKISIGKGVNKIYRQFAFGCSALSEIIVDKDNASYKSIDGSLYNKSGLTLIQYASGKENSSFVIPDDVTELSITAFNYAKKLTSIIFPTAMATIGEKAFLGCISLSLCDFRNATVIPSLGPDAFYSASNTCKIVVPDSLYDQWIVASNWTTYASQIVKSSEYTEA